MYSLSHDICEENKFLQGSIYVINIIQMHNQSEDFGNNLPAFTQVRLEHNTGSIEEALDQTVPCKGQFLS